MDKYIGFDVDSKKTVACVVQEGKKDIYQTLPTDPEAMRQWRSPIQHRRKLVNGQTQVKNRIRSHLKSKGYRQLPFKGNWWTQKCMRWLRDFFAKDLILQDQLDQLELLRNQIKRATARLDERLRHHPGGSLLMTISGVGPRTSEAVLAYTDEVERFARGKQYCSYFGMTPKLDESGSFRRLGHITKQGPSVVRWLIVESAWRAIKKSPALLAFYERVRHGQVKRNKIAIVATAHKMLSIMRAMQQSGECFNEKLVLEQRQFSVVEKPEERFGRRRDFFN